MIRNQVNLYDGLKDLKAKQSRAARYVLNDYPVIDADINTNAYSPALEDYIAQL